MLLNVQRVPIICMHITIHYLLCIIIFLSIIYPLHFSPCLVSVLKSSPPTSSQTSLATCCTSCTQATAPNSLWIRVGYRTGLSSCTPTSFAAKQPRVALTPPQTPSVYPTCTASRSLPSWAVKSHRA